MAANRRIIIAMSMLLVAIFASVSVTFAWFSSGTLATAMFNLTTRSINDYLYIQVDETKIEKERSDSFAQSNVRLEDLTYAPNADGQWGLSHKDGSAAGSGEYILHNYTFYTNEPRKTVYLRLSESGAHSEYMSRKFSLTDKEYWLRQGKENEEIAKFYGTTDINSTNDRSSSVLWREGEPEETVYYFNSSGAYATSAANAARIMFFPNDSNFFPDGNYSYVPTKMSDVIWEPNQGAGYDVKDDGGNYMYEQISSYYWNSFRTDELSVSRSDPGNTPAYSVISDSTALFSASEWRQVDSGAADYHSNVPYKCSVTFVMWIEGRDADCFNVIMSDVLNVDFSFHLL